MQNLQQESAPQRPLCYTHKSHCHLEEHSAGQQVGASDSLPLVYTCTLKFTSRKTTGQQTNGQQQNQAQ